MAGPDFDGALIASIGNFATTAVSPLTAGPLVVAAWFLWRRANLLRLIGAGIGVVLAVPDLMGESNAWRGAGALLGSVAAGLLWAEVLLTIVIPLVRTAAGIWERLFPRRGRTR